MLKDQDRIFTNLYGQSGTDLASSKARGIWDNPKDIVTKGRDPEGVAALEAQVEAESTALYATGRIWDDGLIDPRDTRTVLALALSAVHSAPVQGTSNFGVFRM